MACSNRISNRYRQAFFSIDAAFAFLTAVTMFVMLSAILLSASVFSQSQAQEISGENLALRFSSYVLDKTAVSGGIAGRGSYSSANEIDGGAFAFFDGYDAISKAGASYASIRVIDAGGSERLSPPPFGPKPAGGIYCAQRLALFGGELVRLEACIS